ncbi:hypothetical protein SK128_001216 [Halocaridina rubra]|uniref:Uncharacterized protein n=1 Tax=Halocaridina rubra TaxID=373956 RepID=A0AAN9AFA8_HALRR
MLFSSFKPEEDTNEYGINLEEETKLAEAMRSGEFDNQPRNIDLSLRFQSIIIREPEAYRNQSLYDVINSKNKWKNVEFVRKLQDTVVNGDHKQQCSVRQHAPLLKKVQYVHKTQSP